MDEKDIRDKLYNLYYKNVIAEWKKIKCEKNIVRSFDRPLQFNQHEKAENTAAERKSE